MRAVVALLLIATGCGPAQYRITRTLDGEERTGAFVSPFSYEHFVRGELASLRGDLGRAEQEYALARAGAADDPLLIARQADVVDRLGREDEALALLEQGAALDPESELVWLTRGRIHERHGRIEQATEAYARAASVAPESDAGPLALAALLRAHDQPEEADAVLARYLDRAGGAGAARARLALAIEHGRGQAAADAVRALLEVAPARAEEVRDAARTALRDGKPELAQRLLLALPEAREDRDLRLRAAIEAGDRDGAEGLLAQWMPSGPGELVTVARGYLAIEMPERAAELARVALADGGGAEARLVLARALAARGELGDAAAALGPIEPGSGGWHDATLALATILRRAGRPALAAEVLGRAQAQRASVELAIATAGARMEAGNPEGALAALEGNDPRLGAARAHLLERLGRVEDAVRVYASLPVDDPALDERTRARAVVARAWQRGDREDALARLAAWTARAPDDLLARARHAELLAAVGRAADARALAAETLRLAVDAPLRQRLRALVGAG